MRNTHHLRVDSPFFSTIVLFKNQLFPQGFGWYFRRRIEKNGEGTPRNQHKHNYVQFLLGPVGTLPWPWEEGTCNTSRLGQSGRIASGHRVRLKSSDCERLERRLERKGATNKNQRNNETTKQTNKRTHEQTTTNKQTSIFPTNKNQRNDKHQHDFCAASFPRCSATTGNPLAFKNWWSSLRMGSAQGGRWAWQKIKDAHLARNHFFGTGHASRTTGRGK